MEQNKMDKVFEFIEEELENHKYKKEVLKNHIF